MTLLFFLSNVNFITEVIQNLFSFFSELKPKKSKCEIIGTVVLKEIQMALCSMGSDNFISYQKLLREKI